MLLSKIELNEDQLNKLIEEQNKTEGGGSGNVAAAIAGSAGVAMENPQAEASRMENPQQEPNIVGRQINNLSTAEMDNQQQQIEAPAQGGLDESGGDLLSLEQIASGNIASITRIDSDTKQATEEDSIANENAMQASSQESEALQGATNIEETGEDMDVDMANDGLGGTFELYMHHFNCSFNVIYYFSLWMIKPDKLSNI